MMATPSRHALSRLTCLIFKSHKIICSLLIKLSALDHNKEQVLVRGNQNLLLVLATHSEEGQIVVWVQIANH